MHKAETEKGRTASLIAGILLIGIGFFLLLVLIGFKPEESPHFATVVVEQPVHFFGWAGIRIASTCFVLLGRASVYLTIMLMYAGYVILRPIRALRKTGYILLAAVSVFIFSGLFTTFNASVLHRGGGLCGQFMVTRLAPPLSDWLLSIFFLLPMLINLFILFRVPTFALFRLMVQKDLR